MVGWSLVVSACFDGEDTATFSYPTPFYDFNYYLNFSFSAFKALSSSLRTDNSAFLRFLDFLALLRFLRSLHILVNGYNILPVIFSGEDFPKRIELFVRDFLYVYHYAIYHHLISVNSLDVIACRESVRPTAFGAAHGLFLSAAFLDRSRSGSFSG